MKNILVLGATSGIAKSICYEFASSGANLTLAGRNIEELYLMAGDINIRYGINVAVTPFDALDFSSHKEVIESSIKKMGQLDGVFLAYGFMGEQQEAESNFDVTKKMIDVNYTSAVSFLNIAAKYFEDKKSGFICALSSVAGDRGRQSNYIYGSTKAALSIYLQGLRNRLSKSKVSVITVKPGFVDTKMTYGILGNSPLIAKPEMVAKKICKAIYKKKNTTYVPSIWMYIMLIIKLIPEKLFKKLSL